MVETGEIKQPFYLLLILILAGEAIFILPFVLDRIFAITFLEVFNLTNYERGLCYSTYGIVALFSYILGGSIADRFKPNVLMSSALILTALGGFAMATIPSYFWLKVIFGYWGFTTIFLFWSPMIKATRIWGGHSNQGKAFGFLDGGRGLVSAAIGSIGLLIFATLLGPNPEAHALAERQMAFKSVVLFTSIIVAIIGVVVFFFLKYKPSNTSEQSERQKITLSDLILVSKIPTVIWLMLIILCAYVGYKITGNFSLYASQVMNFNEVESAEIGSLLLYIRPIVGISIGFLADITKPSKWISIGFIFMLIGSLLFSTGVATESFTLFFFIATLIMALGIYAVRVLYFAVLDEGHIPIALTGTAVGIISFIGYTPDIFVGPIKGYLLDQNPGILGHQHVFIGIAIFALIGLFAANRFNRAIRKMKVKKDL